MSYLFCGTGWAWFGRTCLFCVFCSSARCRWSKLKPFDWCNALATPSCHRHISVMTKQILTRTSPHTSMDKQFTVTCIRSMFGCLLLKCDTGLSLETRNSRIICKMQNNYYKMISIPAEYFEIEQQITVPLWKGTEHLPMFSWNRN